MNTLVTFSIEADRKKFAWRVVGVATCPWCAQADIKVVNDNGVSGSKKNNYLEKHKIKNRDVFCKGSEKPLTELGIN